MLIQLHTEIEAVEDDLLSPHYTDVLQVEQGGWMFHVVCLPQLTLSQALVTLGGIVVANVVKRTICSWQCWK